MKIYKLLKFEKNKIKIYINDYTEEEQLYIDNNNYFLFIYSSEIYKYKLTEDFELSRDLYNKLLKVHKERLNNKALGLLEKSNKTSKQLMTKLLISGYNKTLTEELINRYINSGILNDYNYAKNYIESNINKQSLNIIKNKLQYNKGIDKNIIETVLLNIDTFDDKQNQLKQQLLDKKLKGRNYEDLDYKEKSKINQYLYSKGFK